MQELTRIRDIPTQVKNPDLVDRRRRQIADAAVKLFIERGFLLDKDMLDFLNELKDEEVANEILNKIALISREKLITKNLVDSNLEKIKPVLIELDKEKKKVVEKTIVQPPFSRRGQLSISESALSQMVMHCILEYNPEITITKILLDPVLESFRLEVKLCVPFGLSVPKVLTELQDYIINDVEKYSGVHIDSLHLTVDVLK